MTQLVGRLNQSVNGKLIITPSHPFIDESSNPPVLVSLPYEAAINNGQFSVEVPHSENVSGANGVKTEGITYKFELFEVKTLTEFQRLDGSIFEGTTNTDADGNIWSGATQTPQSISLARIDKEETSYFIDPFFAIVPFVDPFQGSGNINITELIGITAQQPYLDITLFRLAKLLTDNPTYRDKISGKLIVKGQYSDSENYVFNDVVSFNGSSFVCLLPSVSGVAPNVDGMDSITWVVLAKKGEPGGTGAQSIGYNPDTWGTDDAASRRDVRDAVEQIRQATSNIDLSEYAKTEDVAPRRNPQFTGTSIKRPPLVFPVSSSQAPTEIATAGYVAQAIAESGSNFFPAPLAYARRVQQLNFNRDVNQSIVWDNRRIGLDFISTNGEITIQENGDYLFFANLLVQLTMSFSSNQRRVVLKLNIFRIRPNSVDLGSVFFTDNPTVDSGAHKPSFTEQGLKYIPDLRKNDVLNFRIRVSADGNSTAVSQSGHRILASQADNYMLMWRVA